MTQRDIIQEIKQVKWELRQHCSPENLTKLYNLIDRLEVPQENVFELQPSDPLTPEQARAMQERVDRVTQRVPNPFSGDRAKDSPGNPCGGSYDDIRLSGYNSTREG